MNCTHSMELIQVAEKKVRVQCLLDEGHPGPHRFHAARDDDAGRYVLLWEGDENFESLDAWEDRLPPSLEDLGVQTPALAASQDNPVVDLRWEAIWIELGKLSEDIPVESVVERWDSLVEEAYARAAAHYALAENIEGSAEMIQAHRDNFRSMFE